MSQTNRKAQHGRILVGITGASGAVYGLRLVRALLDKDFSVILILTDAARQVMQYEVGIDWPSWDREETRRLQRHFGSTQVDSYDVNDITAHAASGSAAPDAMVIAPCSMGTVGRLAAGLSGTLLERAADVMLKEKRALILVPRETPLSVIHLENLTRLARAGATILPAMPGFYHQPQTPEDLTDFIVGKILDQLHVPHQLFAPWQGND